MVAAPWGFRPTDLHSEGAHRWARCSWHITWRAIFPAVFFLASMITFYSLEKWTFLDCCLKFITCCSCTLQGEWPLGLMARQGWGSCMHLAMPVKEGKAGKLDPFCYWEPVTPPRCLQRLMFTQPFALSSTEICCTPTMWKGHAIFQEKYKE